MQTGEITYRPIACSEIDVSLFSSFVRTQVVQDCWRKENGRWQIRSNPFTDDWNEADYLAVIHDLKDTLRTGGFVFGAFSGNALKGFVAVDARRLGSEGQYADLTLIQVSREMRGKGIGRTLFTAAKVFAGKLGAEKLYISAHSSVESQAFYRAMGCVEATEYDPHHVEAEPFDCQLECALR